MTRLHFARYSEEAETNQSEDDSTNSGKHNRGLPNRKQSELEHSQKPNGLYQSGYEQSGLYQSSFEQSGLYQSSFDHSFDQSGFDRSFNQSGYEHSLSHSGFDPNYHQSGFEHSFSVNGFDHNYHQSGFERSLRVDNVQSSAIPILGRKNMSSVVMMSQADSIPESLELKKMEAEQGEKVAPFPALSRRFEVNLFSRQHIGLLVSTTFAGILLTCLKRGVLPLLEYELKMKSYQVDATHVLIQLPWSYSFIWGFISDAVPILDSRRKSYIILAWVMTMLACFSTALLDQFVSYRAEGNDVTPADVLRHAEALMDAYIFLLMVANFGCIVALVIGETYVIAQTRRERMTVRGTALGTLLIAQSMGQIIGQIIADHVIFNVTDLGTTPKVTLRQTMLFFVFYTVIPLIALCTCFFEKADPPPINAGRDRHNRAIIDKLGTSVSELQRAYITASNFYQRLQLAMRGHWVRLRNALSKESTSRITRFLVGFIFMSEFSLTYPTNRLEEWCGMNAKAASLSNSMSEVFTLLPVLLWKYFLMNSDWRWCVFTSFVIVTLIPQLVYYMMATLNPESRNIDIYAFVSALTAFLRSTISILELAITAEIAPMGGEGAFLGIVVSIASSMRLMANTVSNLIGFMFKDVENAVSGRSDPDRMQVAFALVLSHIIQVLGLVALVFLPKQKRHLQRLHRFGDKDDRCTTWWILACLLVSFIISTVFNALAIAPTTSCMGIVGGSGC